MKRDKAGKFTQAWDGEPKQAVKLSLTKTAWQRLEQQAQALGISRSELIEHYARYSSYPDSLRNRVTHNHETSPISVVTTRKDNSHPTKLQADRIAALQQENVRLQQQITALQQTVEELRSQEQQFCQLVQEQQWLEAVLNLIPTPLFMVDPEQMRVTFSNQAANAIAGVDLAKDVGATYNADYHCTDENGQLIPPEQLPAVRAARGEKIEGIEINWHTPVGVFPLLVYADTIPAMYDRAARGIVIFEDIRDRKQIEEQLRESQRFIQQVADATPGSLYIYDLIEQRSVYMNRQMGEVLGYTLEQIQEIGDPLFPVLMHPDDLASMPTHLERFGQAQPGDVIEREYRMRHANGEWRWLWSRDLIFSRTQTGVPHQVLGISHDITSRKQAELRLQETEERLQLALSSAQMVAWDMDLQTNYVVCSPNALEFWGLQSGTADDFFCNVHPKDQECLIQAVANAIAGKEHYHQEYRVLSPDQTVRWLSSQGQVYFDNQGQPIRMVGVSLDITDAKRHEAERVRIEHERQQAQVAAARAADRTARLQTVTAALSEALTPVDVATVIVEQALAALGACRGLVALLTPGGEVLNLLRAVGYPPNTLTEWQSFPLTADVPLAHVARTQTPIFFQCLEEIIASYPQLASLQGRIPGGAMAALPLVVEHQVLGAMTIGFTEAHSIREEDRAFILALARQCAQAITRAQLYEAEQQARSQAEAANRTKDEFLAVLSHELRTPMNPILGWTRLLRQGNLDANRTVTALETIERNAKLQAQLIEDLLDVSRILQGKLILNVCPVNLASVVEAALETVRLAAEAKQIQITVLGIEDLRVSGDAGRLQQIIWNLLSNAVKFTPTGGQIQVCLERVNSNAQIRVKDTGKGISPTFLPYVFDYFRQEDGKLTRKFGGLGLGLAIVRYLTELHGGTVDAESLGEGQGATFTIQLPLMISNLSSENSKTDTTQTVDLSQKRILLVDDEADMRSLGQVILEQHGAEVILAASAVEALQAFDRQLPDVLISDIGMPEMDGYMLMRQVRQRSPDQGRQVPAIALTAYAGEYDQQQALKAGFQRHIAKPVEPENLVQAIAALLDESTPRNMAPPGSS